MKDMFCASQTATAICLSLEEGSSSSTIQLGGGSISSSRTIDRFNPLITDSRRTGSRFASAPCSARSPISPKPQSKNRKSFSKENKKKGSRKPLIGKDDEKRKSNADGNENKSVSKTSSWRCTKPGEFITPPGSSRYLLGEKSSNMLDALSDNFEPVLKLVPSSGETLKTTEDETCHPPSSASANQVVVLSVSLHCRGCERKMRKHISRMQGVKSFNIDFAAKKVTVIGDVTPLGVLASISKVKNAQLWTPTLTSSVPAPILNLSNSDFINNAKQLPVSNVPSIIQLM